MSQPTPTPTPHGHRPSVYTVAASVWAAIDIGALLIQILLLFLFQPDKGLLPSPNWLTDPIAGWVVGNILGALLYRSMLRLSPSVVAAGALVLVALAPVVLVKYAALAAFVAALVIGLAAGSLFWRARQHADAELL